MSASRAKKWWTIGQAFERKAEGMTHDDHARLTTYGLCCAVSRINSDDDETFSFHSDHPVMEYALEKFKPPLESLVVMYGIPGFWAPDDRAGHLARAMFCYLMALIEEER